MDEAADVLGISPATADRHWAYARAWLRAERPARLLRQKSDILLRNSVVLADREILALCYG